MTGLELSANELMQIIAHVKKWLTNLLRAKEERRKESVTAVRAVITAVREGTIYLRSLREGGGRSIEKERELSLLWVELSFQIEDLGLEKLSGRCNLMSKYWADPSSFEDAVLARAGERLGEVEEIARLNMKDDLRGAAISHAR